MRLAGRDSYGKIPKVFLDNDIVKMEFDIHDFANQPEKCDEYFYTGTIKAHGHLWMLKIYHGRLFDDDESVSIGLIYAEENTNTDPVVAKAWIRTKTTNHEIPRHEFSKAKRQHASFCNNFAARKDIIENNCNEAGTLTITVELQVATEKRSVWYPQLTHSSDDIVMQLYNSNKTSDVITFIIGTSRMEFEVHKCILFLRARILYELVVTESSSSSYRIELADVDEKVFEILLKFLYTGKIPTLNDDNEELAKSILLAANRFGVTELKLYMESILVEKFLVPSNAAALLLFADSYTCPLLKEVSMRLYASHSKEVMESNNNEDWTKVKESSKLLLELLVYTNSDRPRYSPAVDENDNATIDDVDQLDVTSLRERLQKVNLDVDGSRDILVQRWKDYVRVRAAKNNNDKSSEIEIAVH